MFKNVIVGVDGREGGRDAIALARLLKDADGELTLAYIYPGEAQIWRGSSPAYDIVERQRSDELLEAAREEAGIEAKIRWWGATSVGRGLHELAEDTGADLIVIGSGAHSLLHRVLIGDDTRSALGGAPCAVAVATAGFSRTPHALRRIGVGYDGSPESENALAAARALAGAHGAKVAALEAVTVPTEFVHSRHAEDGTSIAALVAEARERIAALGDVEAHAAYGRPGEELARFGDQLDLLVVGSRGYGPVGRLLHGSTSADLARSARCPLLVLTKAYRAAAADGGAGGAERASVGAGA